MLAESFTFSRKANSKLVQVSSPLFPKVLDDVGSILILGHPV